MRAASCARPGCSTRGTGQGRHRRSRDRRPARGHGGLPSAAARRARCRCSPARARCPTTAPSCSSSARPWSASPSRACTRPSLEERGLPPGMPRTTRSSSSSAACRACGQRGRGGNPQLPFRGQGSGFIISADGLILTNAHVVREAKEVTVKLSDRREFTAKVLGSDPVTDVAVLRIDAKDLPTVRLGDPKQLEVGDPVLAIGAPYGLEQTRHAGHRQRQGPLAAGRRGGAVHPDRRGGQPGQLGRPAVRRQRRGGRHQRADLLAERRLPGPERSRSRSTWR